MFPLLLGGSNVTSGPQKFVNFARPAHGATFSASSSFSANFSPNNAGNDWLNVYNNWGAPSTTAAGTAWAGSTGTGTEWFEVDCGAPVTPTLINVIGVNDTYDGTTDPTLSSTCSVQCLVDFKTQYWNGSAYVDINTVTGNNKIWRQFTGVSGITAQRFRVLMTSFGSSTFPALSAFQVYGYTPQLGPQILPVGDSLTAGTVLYTVPWPEDFAADLPRWTVSGTGVLSTAGTTMNIINTVDWWKVQPLIDQRASKSVANIWAGINDLGNGATGAATFASLSAYYGKITGQTVPIHVTPDEVWIDTMLQNIGYGDPTQIDIYDASIVTNTLGAHSIVNLHTLPTMQDPADLTKYQADELHPTNLGGQLIANYIETFA